MRPGRQSEWPFHGREAELDVVVSALSGSERPGGIVVAGAAGIGKSRLIREALARSAGDGTRTVLVRATRSARSAPLAVLTPLLSALMPGLDVQPAGAGPENIIERWRRVVDSVSSVSSAAEAATLIVAVDDAHLLDDTSAAMLMQLVSSGGIRLLAGIRHGEPTPDAVSALWKDGILPRADLRPLDDEAMRELIEMAIGETNDLTHRALGRYGSGNVLFVRELVLAAIADRSMRRIDGLWNWDGEVPQDPRLIDVVGTRLRHLRADELRGLVVTALAEPVPNARASEVVTADVWQRLENEGLVRMEVSERMLRLVHPLYGDIALTLAGAMVRDEVLNELLHGRDADDGDERRVVQWMLELGATPDPEQLIRAARAANADFDHEQAVVFAHAAMEAGGGAHAMIEFAHGSNRLSRFDAAGEALAAGEDGIVHAGDPELLARYLAECHDSFYMGMGERDRMRTVLDRVDAAAPSIPLAGTIGYRAQMLADEGRFEQVLSITIPALESDTDRWTQLLCLETGAESAARIGRFTTARALQARMRALAATGEGVIAPARAFATLQECLCLDLEGETAQAVRVLSSMEPEHENLHVRALEHLVRGALLLSAGRLLDARRALRDGVAGYRRGDTGGAMGWALAMIAQIEALRGDVAAAEAALAQSREARLHRPVARMAADFALADARVRAATGDMTGAVNGLGDSLEQMRADFGDLDGSLLAVPVLHRAGCWGGLVERRAEALRRIAGRTGAALPALMAEQLSALHSEDAAALAQIGDRFADLGRLWQASEAAGQAADAYARSGRSRAADRERARSSAWLAGCQGGRLLMRRDIVADAMLSLREREVVDLAALGCTNAQISERLHLSVRTVESHLYAAFGKLGIRRRSELAARIVGAGSSA